MQKFYQLMNIVAQRNYAVAKMKSLEDLEEGYPRSMTLTEIRENIENSILGTNKNIQEYLDNLEGEHKHERSVKTNIDESVFTSHLGFLDFLENAVAERWVAEWPEYFVVASDVDKETYNACNHVSYGWYMAFRNGEFYNRNYKIVDADKVHIGTDGVIAQRNKLYEDMMKASDIRIWTMENYKAR